MQKLGVPLIIAVWLIGYWAPWLPPGSGTAWLAVSAWLAAHGLNSLAVSSVYVTAAVTSAAALGAILRVASTTGGASQRWQRYAGLFLTCAPLCVLLPGASAASFLAVSAAVALAGWWMDGWRRTEPSKKSRPLLWQRLLRESFPILAALCFLTLSWQYNAQWLTRGLLVAFGTALIAQAAVPAKESLP